MNILKVILGIIIIALFLIVVIPPLFVDVAYIWTRTLSDSPFQNIFEWMNVDVSASNKVRPYEFINIAVNTLVAIGTIAVAILTIWGEQLKGYLFHPRLKLICIEIDKLSEYDYSVNPDGKKVFFYHLKVKNTGAANATNCRVLLREFQEGENGKKITLSVPPIFTWAPLQDGNNPSALVNTRATVFRKQSETLAFCRLYENSKCKLHIVLSSQQYFQGQLDINKIYRLGLETVCDNWIHSPSHLQFFEVSWNGKWDNDPKVLFGKHLIVKDVTDEVIGKLGWWKRVCRMICGQNC